MLRSIRCVQARGRRVGGREGEVQRDVKHGASPAPAAVTETGMDVGMDMMDFAGVPLSDVDFSGVPGGGEAGMLDVDALLSSSSATGDGAGAGETKDGGAPATQ